MKKHIPALIVLTICHLAATAQWVEIWSDEFEYEGLPDSTKWSYDVGGDGWGNGELQYYTQKRTENAYVSDGMLRITARREPYEGNDYTSARLVTKNKGDWLYGRIEVRARIPAGTGVWPAIWMLPTDWEYGNWPASGEIDIMEYVGWQPDTIHGTVHTDAYNHTRGTQHGSLIEVPDCEEAFHVYAVEWSEDKIEVSVDDTPYFTFENDAAGDYATWPFDKAFHLILNIAVGGSWGGVHGVDDSIFPQDMLVDYVRVYKRNTSGPFTLDTRVSGEGIVSVSPQKDEYALNDTVIIRAVANEGHKFLGWMGDIDSSDDSLVVTMTKNLNLTAWFDDPHSLLINGDFSGGADGWLLVGNLEGASATGAIENEEYHVSISDGGTLDYAIQLNRPGLKFVRGERYRVTFDARADAPRTIKAKINQSVADWTTYYDTEHNLTTEYRTLSFDFTMEHPTDENARVEFDLGLSDIDVYIDNVKVVRVPETGTAAYAARKNAPIHLTQTTRNLILRMDATYAKEDFTVSLYDLRGQMIRRISSRRQKAGHDITMDITAIPHGTYVLGVEAKGRKTSRVFVLTGR